MAETGHAPTPRIWRARSAPVRRRFRPAAVSLSRQPRRPICAARTSRPSCVLNRRDDSRPKIARSTFPGTAAACRSARPASHVLLGRARAAKAWNTFTCTGEGGYPDRLIPYEDHVITQVATGLFGVREETIQRARIVEFKYAQGAKPGLGGHLLGDKNTPPWPPCARRWSGTSLFSPFPFHSVYSVEDHKKHLDWIAHVNPRALLSAKVSTPTDVDMVAVGSLLRRRAHRPPRRQLRRHGRRARTSPRRTSPCRSSTPSTASTSSSSTRGSATRSR